MSRASIRAYMDRSSLELAQAFVPPLIVFLRRDDALHLLRIADVAAAWQSGFYDDGTPYTGKDMTMALRELEELP